METDEFGDVPVDVPEIVTEPLVAPQPKVKKPMNPAERERNERRKAAFAELKRNVPGAKWTDASKLVSFRNKGDREGERAFMQALRNPSVVVNRPVAPVAVNNVGPRFTRNNAKRSLERVMAKYNLKPSGSLIQKMLGLHRRGNNNKAFLQELNQKTAERARKKTLKKVNNAPKVLTQSAWKEIKAQVNKNVVASGLKLNAINRRALTIARKNRPGLPVNNFMRGRAPRIRKTKKNFPTVLQNIYETL